MFAVTFLAVAKVLVATFVGALMKSSVPSAATTLRDFNFINSMILLPCLTVANTAKSVDLQVLIRCSALLLFGLIFILLGIACALVTSPLLFKVPQKATGIPAEIAKDARLELRYDPLTPEEEAQEDAAAAGTDPSKSKKKKKKKKSSKRKGKPYVAVILSDRLKERGVTGQDVVPSLEVPGVETETYPGYAWGNCIGCSIQNTIALPLPILQTLSQSISWVDYTTGSAYIFVFSIMCTIWTWSGGPIIVEHSQKESVKRHLIREIIRRHLEMPLHGDATTQTGRHMRSPSGSPVTGAPPQAPSNTTAARTPQSPTSPTDAAAVGVAAVEHAGATPTATQPSVVPLLNAGRPPVLPSGPIESDPSFFAPNAAAAAPSPPEHTNRGMQTAAVSSPVRGLPPRGRGFAQVASGPSYADLHAHTPGADSSHRTGSPTSALRDHDGLALETEEVAELLPYDWETEGLIRVFYEADLRAERQAGLSPAQRLWKSMRSLGGRLIRNVNFVSIFVGMFIGVIPFVRNLFFDGPLEIIMDAAILLGGGNVPASLLLLGASLVGTAEVDVSGSAGQKMVRDSEQNTVYDHALDLLDTEGAYEQWFNEEDDGATMEQYATHASFAGRPDAPQATTASDPDAQTSAEAHASHHRRRNIQGAQQEEEAEEMESDSEDGLHKERPAGTAEDGDDSSMAAMASAAAAQAEETEKDASSSGGCVSGLRRFLSMEGINQKFLWGIIFNRLFLCTLVSFLMVLFCVRVFPFLFGGRDNLDRTMVVVLFLQVTAPAAINTSLLYNNREYMMFPWARMLLFMYLLSTITVVGWVTVSLSIVETI